MLSDEVTLSLDRGVPIRKLGERDEGNRAAFPSTFPH
jgi:hypothetical protein